MQAGLPISLFLHGTVLFGALLLGGTVKPLDEGRIIPIELVTIAPETNIRAALKAEKVEQLSQEEEALTLENPTLAAQNIDDVVKETTESLPDPAKQAEYISPDDTALDRLLEPKEVVEKPKEDDFSLDALSGLIDKSRQTAPEKNKQVTLQSETNQYAFADKSRAAAGAGTAMTLSELDALQSAMYKCWRMPADVTDPEKLLVRLQVKMLRGGVVEDVRVIERAKSRRNAPSNPFWDIAEQRAVRAVAKCAPYDFLPDDKFENWRNLILNFRPQL